MPADTTQAAGFNAEQVSADRRHFGDGVSGHEHVDLDEIGSAGIGDSHGIPASHCPSCIIAQNFKIPSRYPDMYRADVYTRMLT